MGKTKQSSSFNIIYHANSNSNSLVKKAFKWRPFCLSYSPFLANFTDVIN